MSATPRPARPVTARVPRLPRHQELQCVWRCQQQVRNERRGGASLQQITTCPECGGRGNVIDTPCLKYDGSGETRRDEVFRRADTSGHRGRHGVAHPRRRLSRREAGPATGRPVCHRLLRSGSAVRAPGQDLYRTEVVDAVLGATIDVPTVDGPASVKAPCRHPVRLPPASAWQGPAAVW